MNSLFGRTVGAILVCVVFYALTQRLLGPVVWLFLAVVIGVAFSRILIDVAATIKLNWFFIKYWLKCQLDFLTL